MNSTETQAVASGGVNKPMVFCRHCLLEIPEGASTCTHCKKDQSKLHSTIGALSAIAASVSVVGAAISYIITSSPQVKKAIAWER